MEQENFEDFIEKIETKSDNELANFLMLKEPSIRDAVKTILDSKMIKSLRQLTKVIEENNIKTGKYNITLSNLTKCILVLTGLMTLATIISILIQLKIN